MTTDCIDTSFTFPTADAPRDAARAEYELIAAIVAALGFVLLLPGAALLMSVLHG